jgi:hypothetical protein
MMEPNAEAAAIQDAAQGMIRQLYVTLYGEFVAARGDAGLKRAAEERF